MLADLQIAHPEVFIFNLAIILKFNENGSPTLKVKIAKLTLLELQI